MKKVEILAPAGSYECLVAALKSGADAIYVGGDRFGARANANNFTLEELKCAIDLVHLHGKSLYLTVNTLLKEEELQGELYAYLQPLYEHGIDAVIVQDLGVLQFVKKHFPNLPIHASTQMTVTNLLGAKFLEEQGVERVVTSRELSVEEVDHIAKQTNLEIESFVHGALCYSFSGQCLYSSMIGGRSGNRGQCAQPCRLPYKANNRTDYFMSLKDICALHEIPELIEAGVFSFKIEGRMKKPEYVASVTSMYRKYVDLYLANGKKRYKVTEEDMDMLRDIFNRGDFHSGYWKQHNGKEMITKVKPSHTGIPVVSIMDMKGRVTRGKALKFLHKGDIIEISDKGDNYTLGQDYQAGEIVEFTLRKGVQLSKGTQLYRTRNQWLIESIFTQLEGNKLQEEVQGKLVLKIDEPMQFHLQYQDVTVSLEGEIVQKAQNAPTKKEKILQQLRKTGNTPFQLNSLDIVMDEEIFLPIQQLNQVRRDGLEQLEQAFVRKYRRVLAEDENQVQEHHVENIASETETRRESGTLLSAYVETVQQFEIVVKEQMFHAIYVDCNILTQITTNPMLGQFVDEAHTNAKKIYVVMPHIFREEGIRAFERSYSDLIELGLDGMMIRNLESYQFLKEKGYEGEILLDHHVYLYNNSSVEFWKEHKILRMTHSLELTAKEISRLEKAQIELVIYGYTPNMISAQCMKKTIDRCTKKSEIIKIKDRINKEISVKNCCDYCYNIVYNTCPTSLLDEYEEIQRLVPVACRVSLTIEGEVETKKVIKAVEAFYKYHNNILTNVETTKGHFRRGVK